MTPGNPLIGAYDKLLEYLEKHPAEINELRALVKASEKRLGVSEERLTTAEETTKKLTTLHATALEILKNHETRLTALESGGGMVGSVPQIGHETVH